MAVGPLLFFLLIFLLGPWWIAAQNMDSSECGTCHESQFQSWNHGKHNTRGVVCAACHGDFHSGTLNGCTGCHTGEHNLEYRNWQFVKDYMVEGDTSDYYCIVCHDPHNPKKAKVLLCNSCHGSSNPEVQPRKSFRIGLQRAHNVFAEVAPRMDEGKWNRWVKSKTGKIGMTVGGILIAGILVFPYFYTGFAFFRWLKRKFQRKKV